MTTCPSGADASSAPLSPCRFNSADMAAIHHDTLVPAVKSPDLYAGVAGVSSSAFNAI